MTEQTALKAERRPRAGKGAARATRRAGLIPAVIYGGRQDPLTIALEPKALLMRLGRPGFFNHIFEIEVDGEAHRVLPRDVQVDPVTDRPLHVDFLRFREDVAVTVTVPVVFVNEAASPGLKRGGVLNIVRHDVEVSCRPSDIPDEIRVDLTGWDIGDSIHISHVGLPETVRPTITDRDFTVATIAAPTVGATVQDGEEGEAGADGS